MRARALENRQSIAVNRVSLLMLRYSEGSLSLSVNTPFKLKIAGSFLHHTYISVGKAMEQVEHNLKI
jgi:hypothetical protein